MSQARLKSLRAKSIDTSSVKSDGRYTSPRTWGVYQVKSLPKGKRYRFGNHPVRMQELEREFAHCTLKHWCLCFYREDAMALTSMLNAHNA